jgi:PAS domain S-box-containing protein
MEADGFHRTRRIQDTEQILQAIGDSTEGTSAEKDLDRFFTMSLDLLCIAGFDGYFKRLNPSWERMLGYTTDELLAEPYLNFIHPADRHLTNIEAEKNAAGGQTMTFENRYRCKDGSYRWLLWSAMPSPEQPLIYAIARDVTERKQAEEALRKSEEKYRTLFDSIDTGVCTIHMLFDDNDRPVDYRFLEVNSSFEALTGIQNARGRRMREIAPLHEQHWFDMYGKIALTGEPVRFENQAAQLHRWYDVYAFRVGESRERRVAIHFKDITERKLAEEAVRESEERFRNLANNMSQLAWMADEQGAIFWYNQRWFDYSGTTLEDMKGWGWQKVHHPEHVQRVVDKIRHCFQTGEVWEDTFPLRGKDGQYRWFLSRAVPIQNEQGNVLRWFGTNTDITSQREAAEELKKNREQLEAANKELEAFSYSVSHDLRAPLRYIDGFADLLNKHASSMLDEKGLRLLRTISNSAKQMGRLIDDLLAFSRTGRTELRKTDVVLDDLVKEVLQDMKSDLQARPISWTIGALPRVQGDRSMLRQVFSNLIGNAVKYTGKREQPVIEIGTLNGTAGDTVIVIRDNGVGFDMQYVDKLFGVFQRLHRADQFEGTGIGLANVQRIVTRHGGRVWAEGAVDQGATFYVSLPQQRGDTTNER